jgi:hypothetical protein
MFPHQKPVSNSLLLYTRHLKYTEILFTKDESKFKNADQEWSDMIINERIACEIQSEKTYLFINYKRIFYIWVL